MTAVAEERVVPREAVATTKRGIRPRPGRSSTRS